MSRPVAWRRRIGGRSGITTRLPEGCYSDDSQLRLATGRAIGPSGFDVEAFAKVELPVWLSYGLGGGRSTIAASVNLSKPSVPWFGNTFKGWINSGGNGAAMRIQPHVWAAQALDVPNRYLPDVVRNTICTHSHPVGLLGSVIHALALAHTLAEARHPSFDDLLAFSNVAADLPGRIREDTEVGANWRAAFEREAGVFDEAWRSAIGEYREAVESAHASVSSGRVSDRYGTLVERLKLRDPTRRGSGTLTAIASVGLLWCESEPSRAMQIAANELGTDTDTIASMAGALVGAAADSEPPNDVLDAALFRSEADRLTRIACGGQSETQQHRYPDLLRWSPPRGRADALVRTCDGGLYVRGLGPAKKLHEHEVLSNGKFQWQWVEVESGQSLLIKRRASLALLEDESEIRSGQGTLFSMSNVGSDQPAPIADRQTAAKKAVEETAPTDDFDNSSKSAPVLNLDRALNYMVKHLHDDRALGFALRRVVDKGTRGQIAVFTAELIDELHRYKKSRQQRLR